MVISTTDYEVEEGYAALLEISATQCVVHAFATTSVGFIAAEGDRARGARGDGRLRCYHVPFIDESEYGCTPENLVAADDREQARRDARVVHGHTHVEGDFWAAQERLTDPGIDAQTALAFLTNLPRLVVSQRGACSFAEKAAAASTLGHAALLVVDTTRADPLPIMDITGEPDDIQEGALALELAAIVGESRSLHDAAGVGSPLGICLGPLPPQPPPPPPPPAATAGTPLVRDEASLASMGLGPCVVRRETCAAPCAGAAVTVTCGPTEVVAAGACIGLATWATSAPSASLRAYECLGVPVEQPFTGLVAAFATCCGR
jgi:hypothetical protein